MRRPFFKNYTKYKRLKRPSLNVKQKLAPPARFALHRSRLGLKSEPTRNPERARKDRKISRRLVMTLDQTIVKFNLIVYKIVLEMYLRLITLLCRP